MTLNFDRFFGSPTAPVPGRHFLAAGCSHTSAVGVEPNQAWPEQLSTMLSIPACNLAEPGGNAWIAGIRISRWIMHTGRPEFVAVQWPHPMRMVIWKNGVGACANVHASSDELFQTRLRYSDLNFWADWMQSIITTNAVCRAAKIPCVNFSIDPVDAHYRTLLLANKIELHDQENLWLRDRGAADGKHNSRHCHAAWAKQLQEIINANTTR